MVFLMCLIIMEIFYTTNSQNIEQDNTYSTYISSSCTCLPSHLCADSDPVINGEDKMDIRVDNRECDNYLEICCEKRVDAIENLPTESMSYKGCGFKTPIDLTSRITSDSNLSQFGELPWTAIIMLRDRANSERNLYRCGGSIIHPQIIMTAAHCVVNVRHTLVTVRVGEWDTKSQEEPLPSQDLTVRDILVHPNFHRRSLRNDIALLFLDEAMPLRENIGVICLPPQNFELNNTMCTASGWGKDTFKEGKYSSVLKKVDLPLVDRESCLASLKKSRLGTLFKLHGSFICAGGEENKDTCKGDGGSPLVCPIPGNNNRFFQMGIVSWGIGCGQNRTPGVYVNVPLFIDWIDEQLAVKNFDKSVNLCRSCNVKTNHAF